jgi:Holliday junction resolvase-like predicted endonuclease
MKTKWHVAAAAEAFAAGQFARSGWDVSVQYGANQPEYDLVAVDGDRMLKVSVKGSRDGSWGLTQSFLKDGNYHAAAELWLQKHSNKTVICLVQFKGIEESALPRMYLATPLEITAQLVQTANGRGDTILYEHHKWGPIAKGAGTVDSIPKNWFFTKARLEELSI